MINFLKKFRYVIRIINCFLIILICIEKLNNFYDYNKKMVEA